MAKLWAIIKREYLERVRSKWFLIGTFFGPIFFGAIIIVPALLASRTKTTSDVYNIGADSLRPQPAGSPEPAAVVAERSAN